MRAHQLRWSHEHYAPSSALARCHRDRPVGSRGPRDGVRGELLGFGEAPSPHVLILLDGGEEVAVFTGPGVELYASALTSGGPR